MAPRRKSSAKGSNNNTSASHPTEHHPEHRYFLVRSLEKNDVDMAAVSDLSHELLVIQKRLPSQVLLDLGLGKYKLSASNSVQVQDALEVVHDNDTDSGDTDNGTTTTHANDKDKDNSDHQQDNNLCLSLDPETEADCIDFLLRMKLRRKLLNRLARRLNRVAACMDGEDVTPPGPPKYGDLRLHVDPVQVQAFGEYAQRKEAAVRACQHEREKLVVGVVVKKKVEEEEEGSGADSTSTTTNDAADGEAPKSSGKAPEVTSEDKAPMDAETVKAEEATSAAGAIDTETADNPNHDDNDDDDDAPLENNKVHAPSAFGPWDSVDYDVLREYSDVYEKVLDPTTDTDTYTILNQDVAEDHVAIKYGAGIGASHRSMSTKDKEAEYKRWQTALLARIPEQPTFADLGMDNRVFMLEERKKRALEEQAAALIKKKRKVEEDSGNGDDAMDEESSEKKAKADEDSDSDEKDKDSMDVDEKESGDDGSDDEKNEKESGEDAKMAAESPAKKLKDDDEAEDEAQEENQAEPPKRMNPISLAAVPSFHNQDLRRTKLVHAELMAASIQNHARRRLEAVTRDYNAALIASNRAFGHRQMSQGKLNTFVFENRGRMDMSKKNEYSVQVAVARNQWKKRYDEFNAGKLDLVIPSRWPRSEGKSVGTSATQRYAARPDPFARTVGACMADVVDAVDMIATRRVNNVFFDEPRFVPPPPPPASVGSADVDKATGETAIQSQQRIELAFRQEVSALTLKIRSCEEDRLRTWKKMLKTKAEFDIPHHHVTNMHGGSIHVNLSNYHLMPLPPLQASAQQNIPQGVASRSNIPSYTPARSHTFSSSGLNESKYSAARVRERHSADGSVAPVTEPKKTKEGLYQRPAGRTRKGMAWDSFRGIWIPAPQQEGPG